MLFTTEFNKLVHLIRNANPHMTWGDAFHTALEFLKVSESDDLLTHNNSLYGTWKPQTVRALAGHFWALKCLYREAGDMGRSHAFGRVSNTLFAAWDGGYTVTYQGFISQSGVGTSIISELCDYYRCAITSDQYYTDHTDRVMHLIAVTNSPRSRVNLPTWNI